MWAIGIILALMLICLMAIDGHLNRVAKSNEKLAYELRSYTDQRNLINAAKLKSLQRIASALEGLERAADRAKE